MTLADQAAMIGQDGPVTNKRPPRPVRRTFTAAYKARILAAFDALPEGSPERGALLRKERLYHSHIEHWRKQADQGTLAASTGKPKPSTTAEELARLRAENRKLKSDAARLAAHTERLTGELEKTKTALEIAGKAFALLENISSGADSDER
jgi:transposase-like protein